MVTIRIKENSKQAKAFLELAKSFSFVEFVEPAENSPYDPKIADETLEGVNARKSGKKKLLAEVNDCKLDHTPNARTLKTFSDTDKGIGLTRSKNADDLFKKLGI